MKRFKDFLGKPLSVGDKVITDTNYFSNSSYSEFVKGKIIEFRETYGGKTYIVATFKKRGEGEVTFYYMGGHELIKYEK